MTRAELIQYISANIYPNGRNQVTAPMVRDSILAVVAFLGDAAVKGIGSVSENNQDLVTGGAVWDAIRTYLSSVMRMVGTTTTPLSDGSTTNPVVINGDSYLAATGDVVVYGSKEFWWTGTYWEELGDEASWALKTIEIKGEGDITGGGNLTQNRFLDLTNTAKEKLTHGETAFSWFEDGAIQGLLQLKNSHSYLGPRKGLIFDEVGEDETSDADLYVKEITVGNSTQRVLYSPLPLITEGDQIVVDGTPGGGGGGGGVGYLYQLGDVYPSAKPATQKILVFDPEQNDKDGNPGAWVYANMPTGSVTSISVNGQNYSPSEGVVTLPNYPTIPSTYAWSAITGTPTTLGSGGYGITDAKIENGVITLGSNSITPLTSHQAIYGLTLKVGTSTVGSYTPNSSAQTLTITAQNLYDTIGSTKYHPYGGDTASNTFKIGGATFTWHPESSAGAGDAYLELNSALLTSGDQIVGGGTPGGGGSGASYLYQLGDVYPSTKPSAQKILVFDPEQNDKDGNPGAWVYADMPSGSVTSVAGVSPVNGDIPVASLQTAIGLGGYLPLTGGYIQTSSSANKLRLVTTSTNSDIQAMTSDGAAGNMLLCGPGETTGGELYLKFSNIYAWYGSTYYGIYHSGNLTKSVLTGLLDASGGYYLPLSGGTITSTETHPLTINTSNTTQNYLRFQIGGTGVGIVGPYASVGMVMQGNSSSYIAVLKDNGGLRFYDGTAACTVYHSGNFNPGNYLPLAGGTMTGAIKMSYTYNSGANFRFINNRAVSGGGGWADSVLNIYTAAESSLAGIGVCGNADALSYLYIGSNGYNGVNLRINSSSIKWGNNDILHAGNFVAGTNYVAPATTLAGYGITDWLVKFDATSTLASMTTAGVYRVQTQSDIPASKSYGNLLVVRGSSTSDTLAQVYFGHNNDTIYFRRGTTSNFTSNAWQQLYHTGNANTSDVAWTCSTLTTNGGVTIYESSSHTYRWNLNFSGTTGRLYAINEAGAAYNNILINNTITVTSGYNVGVGTTSPDYKFHIATSTYNVMHLARTNVGDAYFEMNNNGIQFYHMFPSSTTNAMLSLRDGYGVGIGTQTPGHQLHVVGSSFFAGANAGDFVIHRAAAGSAILDLAGNNQTTNVWRVAGADPSTGDFRIIDRRGTTESLRFAITSDGNVGIGIGSPGYKLAVGGSFWAQSGVTLGRLGIGCNAAGWYTIYTSYASNASGDCVILHIARVYNNANNEAYVVAVTGIYSGNIKFTQLSGAANNQFISKLRVVYVNSTSYIIQLYYTSTSLNTVYVSGEGFGTFSAPTRNDSPSGTAVEFSLQTSGISTMGTIVSTGDQVISSDITLKENLAPVTYGVEDIAKTRAVTFDWKDGRGKSAGSIAQDWKPLIPELVHGEEGNMTLAYGQIALVNTILLARKSESHEERIKELEARVAELEMENERLRMN